MKKKIEDELKDEEFYLGILISIQILIEGFDQPIMADEILKTAGAKGALAVVKKLVEGGSEEWEETAKYVERYYNQERSEMLAIKKAERYRRASQRTAGVAVI